MFDPNFIFLAGFMRILRKDFVKKYEGKIINIHPSLLPKYPGLNTHQRAIESNEKWHGCSVHFVTEEVDQGPLIMQSKIPILNTDSSDKLAIRVLKREHIIYPKTAELLISGRIKYKNSQAWLDGKLLQKPIITTSINRHGQEALNDVTQVEIDFYLGRNYFYPGRNRFIPGRN